MAQAAFDDLLRYLRKTCAIQANRELSDGELLDRFRDHRDDAAFAALVHRHGPLVLSVCQRMLGDTHSAEDAFQATFLVLVRRANSLKTDRPVGSWLYAVAQRIALRARGQTAARRAREKRAIYRPCAEPLDDLTWQELRSVLDEEVGRLTEKHRAPIVLCYFAGMSYDQAAQELGWPKSSLTRRLGRALELLRHKLMRRGIALPAGLLAAGLSEKAHGAPVAAFLAINTVKAALSAAHGKAVAAGWLTVNAIALAEGAVRGALWVKCKLVLMVLALGLGAGSVGLAAHHFALKPMAGAKQDAQPPAIKGEAGAKAQKDKLTATDSFGDPLPAGSSLRFGTARYRQGTAISHLAVSGNGKFAVAASGNQIHGTGRVFDLTTGFATVTVARPNFKAVNGIALYPDLTAINGIALSPDGQTFVTSRYKAVQFYNLVTGKELRSIQPERVNFSTATMNTGLLVYSPDGKTVAVAKADGRGIHLIDVEEGTLTQTLLHRNFVFAAAFSPDGKLLAGGGSESDEGNYFGRVWEVGTGRELRWFVNGSSAIRTLAFSPDGKTLAGGGDDAQLRLWDVETGNVQRTFPKDGYRLHSVAFSPDGKTIAAAGDSIRLYDAATGKERLRIEKQAFVLCFSADGAALTGAVFGAIYRWDAASGRQLTPGAAGDSAVHQILVSSDGRQIITRGQGGDGHLWVAHSAKHLRFLKGTWQRGMALSADGRYLVCPVEDESVKFSDPANPTWFYTGTRIRIYDVLADQFIDRFPGFKGYAHDLSLTENGKTVVSVDHVDPKVRFWDMATGKEQRSFRLDLEGNQGEMQYLRHTVLSPDGKTLAAAYENILQVWDAPFSVRLWNMATGKMLHDLEGHFGYVESLAFSPDSRLLVTGSEPMRPNQIYVWNVATGQRVAQLPDGLPGGASCAAFGLDGKSIATAAPDGTITLWETATWKVRAEYRGHRDRVTALAFTPDGRLLSGGLDTTVLAWGVPVGKGN